jgi:hypothetical protein
MIAIRRRDQLVAFGDTSRRYNQGSVTESSRAAGRHRMINSPRAARSATLASISGATTVTTAPEPSSPRIAGSAAGLSAADQHRGPSNPRLADKAMAGAICMAARGYHCIHAARSASRLGTWALGLLRKLQATNNDLLLGKLFVVGYALHIGL